MGVLVLVAICINFQLDLRRMEKKLGRKLNWKKKFVDQKTAEIISREVNISEICARVIASRGIGSPSKAFKFLYPRIEDAENPFVFPDMKKSAERLANAILKKEIIGIFSDADADGITAGAILHNFLKEAGVSPENLVVRVPSRDREGYGLTKEFIDELRRKGGRLLITADCGIRNHEEIKYAKLFEIDVIVCDHHHVDRVLPTDALAIIHPATLKEESPLMYLSGAGVVFELIAATRVVLKKYGKELPRPRQYLDVVSVGTIGDMVQLKGDNRIFVRYGLDQIKQGMSNLGLSVMLEKISAVKRGISAWDIQMRIVPRINSTGRAGKPELSFYLLTEENIIKAREISDQIEGINLWRKEKVQQIMEEIMFLGFNSSSRYSLVIWGEDWPEGIIGLVANKLLEETGKPTCVISVKGDQARGSIRAPEFLNIMGILEKFHHIFLKYGGHSQAAGILLQKQNIELFSELFEKEIASALMVEHETVLEYDDEIYLESLKIKDLQDLLKLEPFGEGNPYPVFVLNCDIVEAKTVGRDDQHIKMLARASDGKVEIIAREMGRKFDPFIGKVRLLARFKSSPWTDSGFEFEFINFL